MEELFRRLAWHLVDDLSNCLSLFFFNLLNFNRFFKCRTSAYRCRFEHLKGGELSSRCSVDNCSFFVGTLGLWSRVADSYEGRHKIGRVLLPLEERFRGSLDRDRESERWSNLSRRSKSGRGQWLRSEEG